MEYILKSRNIINNIILLFLNYNKFGVFFILEIIGKVSFIFYVWRFSPVTY